MQTMFLPKAVEKGLLQITEYPCTTIIAPTGFGKTTAIREFVHRIRVSGHSDLVFLSQTIHEDEGAYFWEDFYSTFEDMSPDFSHSLKDMGLPLDLHARRTFQKSINSLMKTQSKKIVFILDAGSYVPDEKIKHFLEYFIKIVPENFHLLFAARQALISLQSLVPYYNLINRISIKDLTFTANDIKKYYGLFSIPLVQKEAERLHSLSEGWITLIRQNLRELHESGTSITKEHAEKIIDKMIFDPLSLACKDFLSWIGVCKSFSLEQAQYMYPETDIQPILAELIQKGLFFNYDESIQKYCLEGCFASCVLRKCNELSLEERRKRLKSAGDWCFNSYHKLIHNNSAARQYYYQAGNFDALMRGVERRLFRRPYVEDEHFFISYYAACPPEIRMRYPRALLIFAKYLVNSNRRELSEKVGKEFLAAVKTNPNLTQSEIRQYEAMYELFLTYEQYNNLETMLVHLRKTVELISEGVDKFIWPESGLLDVPSILYLYHRKAGELKKEVQLFTEYNNIYAQFTGERTAGAELVMAAEADYMTGNTTAAEITVYKARLIADRAKQWGVWGSAIYLQTRIEMVRGNWPRIEMLLDEAKNTYLPDLENNLLFMSAGDLVQAYVSCKLDQPQTLSTLFKDGWNDLFSDNLRALAPLCVLHMEILLVRKDYVALIAFVDTYLSTARIYPNLLVEIFIEIEIASAYEKIGERTRAVSCLKKALSLAEPDWLIMPFVEFGRYVVPILSLSSHEVNPEFIKAISTHIQDFQEKINMIRLNFFSKEIHHLTQQEVKIAKLAAEGYSNREIADLMFIQESTVKTHLTHIFSKLNIERRTQLRALFAAKRNLGN